MFELLNKFSTLWSKINALPSTIKTIIIFVLAGLVIVSGVRICSHRILEDYTEQVQKDKQLAEQYTLIITPIINKQVLYILDNDKDATNVLLLNYHNTLTSTHGLSYRYMTALTEKIQGDDSDFLIEVWKELEYMHYGEEIEKINLKPYLRIDSISQYVLNYPNIVNRLKRSDAVSASLYPIVGIDGAIGMLIVLYHNHKEYPNDYYTKVIAPVIQPMSSLLDYNAIKERFKEYGNAVLSDYDNERIASRQK